MDHVKLLADFNALMARLSAEVEGSTAMALYDIHRVAENLVLGVLRELFGWRRLRNLNVTERVNFPGLDLADDDLGIAVQVTASASLSKVKETVNMFLVHDLDKRYSRLLVYNLSRKQRSYSQAAIDKVTGGRLQMDARRDIIDFRDVCAFASNTDPQRLSAALEVARSFMDAKATAPRNPEIEIEQWPPTPKGMLEHVIPGRPAETVKRWLGTPQLVQNDSWIYRYLETQVEISIANDVVRSIVIVHLHGTTYKGDGAPWGDFTLGEMTLADLEEMGHSHRRYFCSLRTKEVSVPVRVGPPGAWDECVCGALVVFTGVGALAQVDFDWDEQADCLISDPGRTLINYIAKPGHIEPSFNWFIRG